MKKRNILAVVSFLFPLVGLVLWLAKRKKSRVDANVYGKSALYGVGCAMLGYLLSILFAKIGVYVAGTLLNLALYVAGVVLVVRMSRKAAVGPDPEAPAVADTQQPSPEPQAGKKSFFLKRWVVGLSNVMDRWLFGLTPESGSTVGSTFWVMMLIGFVLGGIYSAISIFSNGKGIDFESIGWGWMVVVGCVVLVPIVVYAVKSIRELPTVKLRIFRGLFVVVWCLVGLALGCLLGLVVVAVVIMVLAMWLILKIFGAAVFGDSGSGGKRRWKLDNGTEVTEERGLLGETYYSGNDGKSYERHSDDTFSRQ